MKKHSILLTLLCCVVVTTTSSSVMGVESAKQVVLEKRDQDEPLSFQEKLRDIFEYYG